MSSHSDKYKALKWKGNTKQHRISEHQHLRKEKRGNFLDYQRCNATSSDIENLIEDVEMLDVSRNILRPRLQWIDFLWSEKLRENMAGATKALRFIRWHHEQQPSLITELGLMPRLFELLFNAKAPNNIESHLLPLLKVSFVFLLFYEIS